MTRIPVVERLARVEGHGGITVETDGPRVVDVQFNILEGPRLLEGLVRGRAYDETAPILSRICSICSASHVLTSLAATEAAFGIAVSPRTVLLRDLLVLGEHLASHALHVFLLALPDLFGVASAPELARAHPELVKAGLRIKAAGNRIQEVVGGRAIHPVNVVTGGIAREPDAAELRALREVLAAARDDVALAVDAMAGLPHEAIGARETTFAAVEMAGEYGYAGAGERVIVAGRHDGRHLGLSEFHAAVSERVVASGYARHVTLGDEPMMVGALARLTLNRARVPAAGARAMESLGLSLPSSTPLDNTRAQVVELVIDAERALGIVERVLAEGARRERVPAIAPRAGEGLAVMEAPRGLLLHWVRYDDGGRVRAAEVITPTAINAASIEAHFRAAVAEGWREPRETLTQRLELVARGYDPCISCAVHLVQR